MMAAAAARGPSPGPLKGLGVAQAQASSTQISAQKKFFFFNRDKGIPRSGDQETKNSQPLPQT